MRHLPHLSRKAYSAPSKAHHTLLNILIYDFHIHTKKWFVVAG